MRNILIVLLLILIWLPDLSFGREKSVSGDTLLEAEIENLKLADSAWRKNDSEYREMRKMGESSETEIREFAEFVAELKRKVIEGCETVRRLGGDAGKEGVNCGEILDGYAVETGMVSSDINELSVPVDESELYREELRKLENDFDDMILQAQDELQKKRKIDVASNRTPGSGSGGGGQNAGNSQKSGNSGGKTEVNAGSPDSESMDGQRGEQGAGVGDHKPGQEETFDQHEKVDSRDDDVVARQLREAAEKETDPVLKEQLWKEYEKYKKSKSQ